MAWVYLDDHWDEHEKLVAIFEADPQALVLFFSSLAYARRSAPDGVIPAAKVRGLLGWRPRSQAVLQKTYPPNDTPAWHELPRGAVAIHDYSEWNRPNASRSASARNAARARWANNAGAASRSQRLAAARARGSHTPAEWERLAAFCGPACLRCGIEFGPASPRVKDHIVPIYQGGSDSLANLQPLCRACNKSKGAESIDYRPAGWQNDC